uniref:Uncharacterized protein n=1 Tax=Cacopsylla melanoneura TaxID=428564 RepID=A0A8D8X1D2_9HEMI
MYILWYSNLKNLQFRQGSNLSSCMISLCGIKSPFPYPIVDVESIDDIETPPKEFSFMSHCAQNTKNLECNLWDEATHQRLLSDAIPLLLATEAFGCWVSPLARVASP